MSVEEQQSSKICASECLICLSVIVTQVGIGMPVLYTISLIVDNVADATLTSQKSDIGVLKLNSRSSWCFYTRWHPDCVISEERIHSDSKSLEISDVVVDFKSSVACVCKV